MCMGRRAALGDFLIPSIGGGGDRGGHEAGDRDDRAARFCAAPRCCCRRRRLAKWIHVPKTRPDVGESPFIHCTTLGIHRKPLKTLCIFCTFVPRQMLFNKHKIFRQL